MWDRDDHEVTVGGRRRTRAWLLAMRLIAPIVGDQRSLRWAVWGMERLLQVRVGGRRVRGPRVASKRPKSDDEHRLN